MSIQDDLRERTAEQRQAAADRVQAAEGRRTLRDKTYAISVDMLICHAEKAADAIVGKPPPRRDPMRRHTWEQAWSREFHKAMDSFTRARGLRQQSHQE